jgi:hypothetical protein
MRFNDFLSSILNEAQEMKESVQKGRGWVRRWHRPVSAKLVPTLADKGVSASQRCGSLTVVISVF